MIVLLEPSAPRVLLAAEDEVEDAVRVVDIHEVLRDVQRLAVVAVAARRIVQVRAHGCDFLSRLRLEPGNQNFLDQADLHVFEQFDGQIEQGVTFRLVSLHFHFQMPGQRSNTEA